MRPSDIVVRSVREVSLLSRTAVDVAECIQRGSAERRSHGAVQDLFRRPLLGDNDNVRPRKASTFAPGLRPALPT